MSIDYARRARRHPRRLSRPRPARLRPDDVSDTAVERMFEFTSVAHQTAAAAAAPDATRSLAALKGLRRRVWSNVRRSLGQRDMALHALCLLVLVCLVLLDVKSPAASLLAVGMLYLLRAGRPPVADAGVTTPR